MFDFPPEARLKTRRDFDRVFAEGRKVVNRQLVTWIAPAAPGGRSRIGLMVSRKVGDSPCRSRTKRILREAFRHVAPDVAEPLELVLLARPGAAPRTLDEARAALEDILRRHARGQGSAPGEGSRGRGGKSKTSGKDKVRTKPGVGQHDRPAAHAETKAAAQRPGAGGNPSPIDDESEGARQP